MHNLPLDIILPVMAICSLIFLGALIVLVRTFLPHRRQRIGNHTQKPTHIRIRAIPIVIASGAVLTGGAVAMPVLSPSARLTIISPARTGPGASAIVGCGPVQIHVSGPHPTGQALVLVTRQGGVLEAQVESHVSWDPGLNQWVGAVTFANTWPRESASYILDAYLIPAQWASYVQVARNFDTSITWWWQTKPPPEYSYSTAIHVQLVRNPGSGQPGRHCAGA